MRKGLAVSMIMIFLPVCTSVGDVGNLQGFLMDAGNEALWAGGPVGAAQNTNVAVVGQNQQSNNPYSFATALQTESGILVQSAFAGGMDGLFGVSQDADVVGGQLQVPGAGGSLGIQDQLLEGAFAQDLVRVGGIGAALGIQSFVGLQAQLIISLRGASANVQYLGLAQADSVGGGP